VPGARYAGSICAQVCAAGRPRDLENLSPATSFEAKEIVMVDPTTDAALADTYRDLESKVRAPRRSSSKA
jgi:hypothetical protein